MSARRAVDAGTARFGDGRLGILAGPCVIESADLLLRTAEKLRDWCAERALPFVFKSSYLKANRSSVSSYAGPGLDEGLEILARVRREIGVPLITDVHETHEVAAAAEVVDILQVPAFLCRQTALLLACAKSGLPVNVKKGQFLAADDMRQVAGKLESGGATGILLTERGTTFGHHDLVVDFRGLVTLGELGWPVVYDASHSLQRPGGVESGGQRHFAPALARAAVAVGVDALFFEAHPDPARARSDAATQLPLESVPALLDECRRVHEALAAGEPMERRR